MGTELKTKDAILINWALRQQGLSYQWGITDCGSLVRQGLFIFNGKDPFTKNIPYWDNEQQARQIWKDLGGVDKAFLDLGAERIHENYIRTGDVGILTILNEDTSFLVIAGRYLFSNEKGVKFRKIISFNKLNVRFYRFK